MNVYDPKEGEWWFVQLPGATELVKAKVELVQIHVVKIAYHSGGYSHSKYFKLTDIEFVEEVAADE